jgi:hypothetical protein
MIRQSPLYPAIRASVLARDVTALHRLLRERGAPDFAIALSSCSPRVAADILSLLSMPDRLRVLPHLPTGVRRHVQPLYRTRTPRADAAPSPLQSRYSA